MVIASYSLSLSVLTRMPSRTVAIQALTWPSSATVTMHSLQIPMPQKTPRGCPPGSAWRKMRLPDASMAAANDSPS
jgi:hypothetical protein